MTTLPHLLLQPRSRRAQRRRRRRVVFALLFGVALASGVYLVR